MTAVALSLGSNLGNRGENISRMESLLEFFLKGPFLKSSLMETEPVGVEDQRWYFNRIISGNYEREPLDLLTAVEDLEKELGRDGKGLLKPRTADIDILIFGDREIKTERLTIPHRGVLERRFCLEGLNQIVPDWEYPGSGKKIRWFFENMDRSVRGQKIRFIQN